MSFAELLDSRLTRLRANIRLVSADETPLVLEHSRMEPVSPAQLPEVGVTLIGDLTAQVFLANPSKKVGTIRIEARGTGAAILIDNDHRGGTIQGNIRIARENCTCILSSPDFGSASFGIISLRSANQVFYWGRAATAVGLSVEIEGEGKAVLVGDDALISSGVWIRNHDMHSIVDLRGGAVTNAQPVDTIIEPHVWIGQDALLLSCQRVGFGSIIGAKSLVRGQAPNRSVVSGVPGRVLRNDTSWGRAVTGMSAKEQKLLQKLAVRSTAV